MHVLDANEIFGMTFYTANRILEDGWRNWPDALALYIKLLAQTRMQETNQTLSKNEFLQKAMWWWRERLQAAKKVLNGNFNFLQNEKKYYNAKYKLYSNDKILGIVDIDGSGKVKNNFIFRNNLN